MMEKRLIDANALAQKFHTSLEDWEENMWHSDVVRDMIAAAPTEQAAGWRDIKEDPPTEPGLILVYHQLHGVQIMYWFQPSQWKYVTHWMPLPEAPEGIR